MTDTAYWDAANCGAISNDSDGLREDVDAALIVNVGASKIVSMGIMQAVAPTFVSVQLFCVT